MDSVSRDKLKEKGFKRLIKSFKYAIEGIIYAFKYEQNIIVHTLVMILVIILGIALKLSYFEWLICLVLIGLVLMAEFFNTAMEYIVDLASPKVHPLAKAAKDTAAAGVLVMAILSAIAGGIIFIPKLIDFIGGMLW